MGCQPSSPDAEEAQLREQIEELQTEVQRLQDSLHVVSRRAQTFQRQLKGHEVLEAPLLLLLTDERTGIWGTDERVMRYRFLREIEVDHVSALVDSFNAEYDSDYFPGLDYAGVVGRTLTVEVRDPEQLGNRMGTTGSSTYRGTATLTLTSFPGVDSLYFDFGDVDEGRLSHASPGYTSRTELAGQIEEGSLP